MIRTLVVVTFVTLILSGCKGVISSESLSTDLFSSSKLNISDTSIAEDSSLTVIRTDADVEAEDEDVAGLISPYSLGTASSNDCQTLGTVSLDDAANGVISFAPTPDYSGTCKIKVVFTLSATESYSDEFSVNVTNVNDWPSLGGGCSNSATEDLSYNCGLSFSDIDGDTPTYSFDVTNNCSWATINSSTGVIGGTPLNAHSGTTCTLAVVVSDQNGGSATNSTSVSVAGANDSPAFDFATCLATVNEGTPYSCTRNASDIDASDTLSYSYTSTCGFLSASGSGNSVSGTPTGAHVGNCSITYSVSDGNGGSDSEVVNVTVNAVNDAPVLNLGTCSSSHTVNEDGAFSCQFNVTDPDGAAAVYSTTANSCSGWLAVDSNTGVLSGTPLNAHVGTCNVTVRAFDGVANSNTQTVNFTINNTNDAPIAQLNTCAASPAAIEDSAFSCQAGVSDSDAGATHTYSQVTNSCGAWLSINSTTGVVSGTPSNGNVGSCSFSFKANDGIADSNVVNLAFTVANSNDNPTLDLSGCSLTATEDAAYSCTAAGTDPDGDSLSYAYSGTCPWITAGTGATATGTPLNAHSGTTCTLSYTVNDGNGGTDSGAITITVNNTNDAPTLDLTSCPLSVNQDALYTCTPNGTDVDGDTLTYTYTETCAWISGAGGSGSSSGTPTNTDSGTSCAINYTVSDGNSGTATGTVNVTVNNLNDPPTIDLSSCSTTATEDSVYACTASGSDPDGDALTYTYTETCAWISGSGTGATSGGTPSNGDVGVACSITYTVNDGNGGTDSDTVNLTVGNTNDAPVFAANACFTSVNEDSPYSCSVTATDADGDALSYSYTSTCGFLSASGSGNTIGSGTPNDAHVGSCSIVFTVNDGNSGSDTETINVNVLNINDNPTIDLTSCATTVNEDSGYSCTATGTDADGDSLTYSYTEDCAWISGAAGSGPTSSGTPANADAGSSCTITYTASDSNGGSDQGSVTVTVNNTNDAPTLDLSSCSSTISEDSSYTCSASASDPDGDILSYTYTEDCSWIAGTGGSSSTSTGTPDNSHRGTSCTINFSVSDGNGGTDGGSVTVSVTNVNDGPTLDLSACAGTAVEDNLYTCSATATDPEGDVLSYSYTDDCAWISGAGGSGATSSGTPVNADAATTCTINYTVSDGNGGSDTGSVSISVSNTNDAPSFLASTCFTSVNEDSPYDCTMSANDPDGDALSYTYTSTCGFLSSSGTGSTIGTGTPLNSHVGSCSFTFSVSDGNGGSDSETVNLTVLNTNDTPTLDLSGCAGTPVDGSPFSCSASGTDDDGDAISYSYTETCTWISGTGGSGTSLGGTPAPADSGTSCSITFTADDGNGGIDTGTVNLTVNNTNDPPVLDLSSCGSSVNQDVAYSCTATATDPDGDVLSYTFTEDCAWMTGAGGSGTTSGGTPTNTDRATTCTIDYTVSDGNGGTDTGSVSVTVNNVNDAPTINLSSCATSVNEDSAYSCTASGSDPDGDILGYTYTETCAWIAGTGTGSLTTGTPSNGDVGVSCSITYTVSDGNGGTDSDTIAITVNNTNDAPTLDLTSCATSINEDTGYTCSATASDPDGDALSYSYTEDCAWISGTGGSGAASTGTPDNSHRGTSCTINYSVSDGNGGTDTGSVTVSVINVNDAPTIDLSACASTVNEDSLYSCTATGTDPEGDALTYAYSETCAWISGPGTGPTSSGTPTNSDSGLSCSITYTVSDANGGSDSDSVTVLVNNTNDAPTLDLSSCATSVNQDSTYTCTAGGSDPDGDSLTYTYTEDCAWISGTGGSSASTSGTPVNSDRATTCSINFTVSDSNGGTDTGSVSVTVNNVNDAPTIDLSSCSASATEDVAYTCTANGTDPDGDLLSYSYTDTCTWIAGASGSGFSTGGTPTNSDVASSCSITYSVSDGNGGTDSDTVTIAVTNVNDAPVLDLTGCPATATEDVVYNCAATASDPDGDTLTYSYTETCSFLSGSGTGSNVGGTPSDVDVGTCAINYSVSDGNGGTDSGSVTVAITNVNDVPSVQLNTCASSVNQNEDAPFSCQLSASDPDSASFTYAATTNSCSSWLSVNSSGAVSGTPTNSHVGTCSVTMKANDGVSDSSNTVSISFTINNVNPVFSPGISNVTGYSEGVGVINITDGQIQADEEGSGTYSLAAASAPQCSTNGSVTLAATGASDGSINFNPNSEYSGTCNIKVTFTDSNGGSVSDEFSVTINPVNDAPSLDLTSCPSLTHTMNEDQTFSCSPTASDIDGPAPTVSYSTTCGWVTGLLPLAEVPNDDAVGSCTVTITATDGLDGAVVTSATFNITVNNVQPTISLTTPASVMEDNVVTFGDAMVSSSDEGLGTYSFDHAGATAPRCSDNGSFSGIAANGSFTFTPNTNWAGTCNIKIVFNDGNAANNTNSAQVTVTVNAASPTVGFTTATSSSNEGSIGGGTTTVSFTITASDATGHPINIPFTVSGSASAGSDFTSMSSSPATIAAGSSSTTISFVVNHDLVFEADQTVVLTLSAPTGGTLDGVNTTRQHTIQNDDLAPSISIGDAVVTETGSSFTASVTVNKTGDTELGWSFDWMTVNGTAIAGDDFTAVPTTSVSALATDTSKTLQVTILGDTFSEPTQTFDIQLSNITGASVSGDGSGTITINDDDGAPAPTLNIGAVSAVSEDGGTQSVLDVTASDGDVGTYTYDTPGGVDCNANGTVSVTATGAVSYSPAPNFFGSCNIELKYVSGANTIYTGDITVIVNGVNDAPTISGTCATTAIQDSAYACNTTVSDPDGDSLSLTSDGAHTCGFISGDAALDLTGTPNDDEVGTCTVSLYASDGVLQSSTALTFSISVDNIDPTLFVPDAAAIPEDSALTIVASDAVVNSSEETFGTYSLVAATYPDCRSHGTYGIDSASGEIEFTPATDYTGTCNFAVQFDDGNRRIVTDEFFVPVTPMNDSPTISAACPGIHVAGASYHCGPSGYDPDGTSLTWSPAASHNCTWASVHPSTGFVSGIPSGGDAGTECTIAFSASDGALTSTVYSQTVRVDANGGFGSGSDIKWLFGSELGAKGSTEFSAATGWGLAFIQDSTMATAQNRFVLKGISGSTGSLKKTIAGIAGPLFTQMRFKLTALSGSDQQFFELITANGTNISKAVSLRMTASGSMQMYFTSGTPTSSLTSTALSLNTWYIVQAGVSGYGPSVSYTLSIFDETGNIKIYSNSMTADNTSATAGSASVDFKTTMTTGLTYFVDDLLVSGDSAPNTTTKLYTINPNAQGTWSQLDVTTNSWTKIDDMETGAVTDPDSSGDAWNLTATAGKQTAGFNSIPDKDYANIYAVNYLIRGFRAGGGGVPVFNFLARVSGTDNSMPLTVPTTVGTMSNLYKLVPGTASVWTEVAIDNMELGIQSDGSKTATINAITAYVAARETPNMPPAIAAACGTSVNQNQPYMCQPTITDTDGPTAVWNFVPGHTCGWLGVDPSTGKLTGTPNDDDVGDCVVAIRANDTRIDSNVVSFTINVNNVSPTLSIANVTGVPNTGGAYTIAVDSAVQASDEGFGTYGFNHAATTAPKCVDNGSLTIEPVSGTVDFDPSDTFTGTCNVTVLFDDGNAVGSFVSASFSVGVTGVSNLPPSAWSSCSLIATQGSPYDCTPNYSDPEAVAATWSFTNNNSCTWLTINSTTGYVSGTPGAGDVGSCTLEFHARDGFLYTTPQNYMISISNVAPSVFVSDVTISEDSPMSIIVDAASSDEGFGTYSFDWAATADPKCNANGMMTIDANSGAIQFQPAPNYAGICNAVVEFNDGTLIGSDSFTVTVTNVNDPAVVGTCPTFGAVGQAYTCSPSYFDADGDVPVSWAVGGLHTCGWLTPNASTGFMSASPGVGGSCMIEIVVTNANGTYSSTPVTLNIVSSPAWLYYLGASISNDNLGTSPSSRKFGAAWFDKATNTTYVFGGQGYENATTSGPLGDVWAFDTAWTQKIGPTTAGATGNWGAIAPRPSARHSFGAQSQAIDANGNLWIYGGTGKDSANNPGSLGDLWKYTPGTNSWTYFGDRSTNIFGQLGIYTGPPETLRPGSRWAHSLVFNRVNNKLYLFGGLGASATASGDGMLNDLWSFDGTNWTHLSGSTSHYQWNSGSGPGARRNAAMWVDSSGDIWLFGGAGYDNGGGFGNLNDLWKYSVSTNTWAQQAGSLGADAAGTWGFLGTPSLSNTPSGRQYAAHWADSAGNLWLYGGYGKATDNITLTELSDLWKYSVATGEWTHVEGSGSRVTFNGTNEPGSRSGAVLMGSDNRIILFGGDAFDGTTLKTRAEFWRWP